MIFAVNVDSQRGEKADHNRLDTPQQEIPPGKAPQKAELPGSYQGDKDFDYIRNEQSNDLRRDGGEFALHAEAEGADQAAEIDIQSDIKQQRHAQVARSEQGVCGVVNANESIPDKKEHTAGQRRHKGAADEAVCVFGIGFFKQRISILCGLFASG